MIAVSATSSDCIHIAARECQVFIGRSLMVPVYRAFSELPAFAKRLPEPTCEKDHMMLLALLMRFTFRWADEQHEAYHAAVPNRRRTCSTFDPTLLTAHLWRQCADPTHTICSWATLVSTEFAKTHPETAAFELRDLLDADARSPSAAMTQVSSKAGIAIRILQIRFRQVVGCSVGEYVSRRRVDAAIQRLVTTDDKVETISRDVGWLSPKELYRAVHSMTGYTPARIRKLDGKALESCLVLLRRGSTRARADS